MDIFEPNYYMCDIVKKSDKALSIKFYLIYNGY